MRQKGGYMSNKAQSRNLVIGTIAIMLTCATCWVGLSVFTWSQEAKYRDMARLICDRATDEHNLNCDASDLINNHMLALQACHPETGDFVNTPASIDVAIQCLGDTLIN